MPQAGIGTGQPDAAFAVLVGARPVRPHRPARNGAVQRNGLVLPIHGPTKPGTGIQPMPALFIAQHHAEHLLAWRQFPGRRFKTPVGATHRGAGHRTDPQAAIGFAGQPIDQQAGNDVGADPLEVGAGPARHAMLGADPQAAIGQRSQVRHRGGRQAAGIVGLGQETLQAVLAVQPVQPTFVGAEPDRTVRRGRQAPDRVGPHQRLAAAVVEMQLAAVGRHPYQARVLGPDPELVARIDQDRPDAVVAQAILRTPDPVVAPVVTGQAVVGGDPQVAIAVFGHAVDGIGRQAVEYRHLARARWHRLRGSG